MANKTLLNATNEILKRVGIIAGDAGLLTSLTDSARQKSIDTAIQVTNEGIADLYVASNSALPNKQAESTITLVTGTRNYTLATTLVMLRWPLIDRTNNQYITEYPGGYNAMLIGDMEQDDTGLPHWAAIRPTDGALFMDRAPTSVENGRVYTYQYDKDTVLTLLTDTVPFGDEVFRAMVPAWAQLWRRDRQNSFDEPIYRRAVGDASLRLRKLPMRDNYSPR